MGSGCRNIGVLAASNTVYAIDLLGLGASDKPSKFQYTMETWAEVRLNLFKLSLMNLLLPRLISSLL